MKTLLTALLFIVFNGAMAQSTWQKYGEGNYTRSLDLSKYIKSDTVQVWFKEVVINTGQMDISSDNGKLNLNKAVHEYWQHGYVVYEYSTSRTIIIGNELGKNMLQESCHDSTIHVVFLYSDRKTLVKNPIILVILQ